LSTRCATAKPGRSRSAEREEIAEIAGPSRRSISRFASNTTPPISAELDAGVPGIWARRFANSGLKGSTFRGRRPHDASAGLRPITRISASAAPTRSRSTRPTIRHRRLQPGHRRLRQDQAEDPNAPMDPANRRVQVVQHGNQDPSTGNVTRSIRTAGQDCRPKGMRIANGPERLSRTDAGSRPVRVT